MNRIQIIRASIIMRKVVTYTIWIAHKHNVTQLLGCVPWEHVSHEHTSPSITWFHVYMEHSTYVKRTFRQTIINYGSFWIAISLLLYWQETIVYLLSKCYDLTLTACFVSYEKQRWRRSVHLRPTYLNGYMVGPSYPWTNQRSMKIALYGGEIYIYILQIKIKMGDGSAHA